jgi:glycosyltransferase involved in cell wall biosynthesis
VNILLLTSSYPRFDGDGTAPFIKSIAETLASSGHQVTVLAPFDPAVRPYEPNGVEIIRFRYAWNDRSHIMGHARAMQADVKLKPLSFILLPLFLFSMARHVFRLVQMRRINLIHANWVVPNGLVGALAARFFRLPLLVSLHGSDVYIAGKNFLFRAVSRWIFRQAAGVTACSPELLERALRLGAPEYSRLVPYGVDAGRFTPAGDKMPLPPVSGDCPPIWIGSIGRLVHKKGFDVLIRAFHLLAQTHPHARLIIAGDGPLKAPLEELAIQLGLKEVVVFPGEVSWSQVPAFLRSLDIFALPSVRDAHGNVDGLPNVLLEAMACGRAVVSSDIKGAQSVIVSGENGLLVPSGDAEALCRALDSVAGQLELRADLGQRARRDMEKCYSWQTAVDSMLDAIPGKHRTGATE